MVYDCFPFFNELDILEIRLNELNDVVDKFVLVEADRTHQNTPKAFIYDQNKERFAKFHDKIIHIKLTTYPTFIPFIYPFTPWKLEKYQRNMITKGLKDCKPDDIIMISDLDEIPNSEVVKSCVHAAVDKIYGLRMDLFLYFLNNRVVLDPGSNMSKEESKAGIWHGTVLLPYKRLTKTASKLRKMLQQSKKKGEVFTIIPNAGWHFSYIGGVKKIVEKLEAFAHTEYNTDQYKNVDFIQSSIENGQDLFGRQMEFEIINQDYQYPKYLKSDEAKTKFADYFFNNKQLIK